MTKCFPLQFIPFLLILTLLSSVTIETTFATIPKPSVPQFIVKLTDNSYDVPTTQSVDPYTGENVTQLGYRVENKTIEVMIKNQYFASKLLYNIRVKGHFSEDWTEVYHPSDGFPVQSNSEYTMLLFSCTGGDDFHGSSSAVIHAPPGGQIDFQVQAMNGNVSREISLPVPGTGWIFTGETSGWSETQTITITDNPLIPSATPPSLSTTTDSSVSALEPKNQSNDLLRLNWAHTVAIVFGVVIVLAVYVAVFLRRKRESNNRPITQ